MRLILDTRTHTLEFRERVKLFVKSICPCVSVVVPYSGCAALLKLTRSSLEPFVIWPAVRMKSVSAGFLSLYGDKPEILGRSGISTPQSQSALADGRGGRTPRV